jgi:hypothetical protein
MNQHKTTSILQRVPVILAVTAASYGLSMEARARHSDNGTHRAGSGLEAGAARIRGNAATQH